MQYPFHIAVNPLCFTKTYYPQDIFAYISIYDGTLEYMYTARHTQKIHITVQSLCAYPHMYASLRFHTPLKDP